MALSKRVQAALAALAFAYMAEPAPTGAHFETTILIADRETDRYILSGAGNSFSTNASLDEAIALRKRFSGGFLWARRDGVEYLIRDPRILAAARLLFDPRRQLEPARAPLERRRSRLEAEASTLDREQEKLERELDRLADDAEHGDLEARRRLETRQKALEAKHPALEAAERELEAAEGVIEQREADLETAAEREVWRLIDKCIAGASAQPLGQP